MSAFNGVCDLNPDAPGRQVCSNCGDEFPEIDEATELCEDCYEHIFGVYLDEDQP